MALLKQRKQALGFLAAAGMFWSMSANALLIDDFSVDQAFNFILSGNSGSSTATTTGSRIVGGTRFIEATAVSGHNLMYYGVNSDQLAVAYGPGVDGLVKVVWDNDGSGLGGVDLIADATGIAMDVISIDLNVTVEFDIEDTNGVVSNSGIQNFTAPGLFFVDFQEFSPVADFASVDRITMKLTGPADWDGLFDIVETTHRVPEPASVLLMSLGLIGMGATRRRVKK